MRRFSALSFLSPAVFLPFLASAQVVLHEIMYHPSSENDAEEYVEIRNTGPAAVDLTGWRLSGGVAFTVPAGTHLAAGAHLVLCANPTAFAAKYPGVANHVAAGWTGRLSNSGDTVTLRDALGNRVDEVSYADDGDWAERRRDAIPDFGHRGWGWHSAADGGGSSLEVCNPAFSRAEAGNWVPSLTGQGTPGGANSAADADIAPIISEASLYPAVPRSTDTPLLTVRVRDDLPGAPAVSVQVRDDGQAAFAFLPLWDDGQHGDGLPGDGLYGGTLPARPNGTVVEWYVHATDAAGQSREWPGPSRDYTGTVGRFCNALYQVDDNTAASTLPLYRLVLRAADRTELSNINTGTGSAPFPFNPGETADQTYSHAKFNCAWVAVDGTGQRVRQQASLRNRGNGSRQLQPQSFTVQFPQRDTFAGRTSFNLNTQDTPYQLLGSELFRRAGLAMGESRAVQVRVNGVNPATASAPSYGFYVCNEAMNGDFADHHFPTDSSGNLYRGLRMFRGTTTGGTLLLGADLGPVVPGPTETRGVVDLLKLNYFKHTNESVDDWADLIQLTQALAKGHSGSTPASPVTHDADYAAAVRAVADVDQWMRFLAVNTFADNTETNISNGDGDDFYLYFGVTNLSSRLIAYDLDSILGRSAGSSSATHDLFRMCTSTYSGNPPTPLNAFMKHPEFAPLYYAELLRLRDGVFAPANLNALAEAVLAPVAPGSVIGSIQAFNASRHAYVTAQVPTALAVTGSLDGTGAALAVLNGYPRALAPVCQLSGRAHAARTRAVLVNGSPATWSAWQASWSTANLALVPGVNLITVTALDENGVEFERIRHSVWHDDLTQVTVSGTVGTTTWTAAGGPYRVNGSITVPSGATLTIEPGATVWLGSSSNTVNVTVAAGGRLVADGTEFAPIRFMLPPGAAYTWGGITVNGTTPLPAETRFAHVVIEGNNSTAIHTQNSANLVLDHVEFRNATKQYVSLDNTSFLIRDCVFPDCTASFEPLHGTIGIPAGGRGIIRDCYFGAAIQYSDVIDFTGGNRPSPILQIIGNVFTGSGDDILDIDGTDAWVEDNLFMNVHRLGSPDSASAVSGGSDSTRTSEITVLRNLFFNCDQAATAKQGNYYTLLHNTIVHQNGEGSEDTETGVVNFSDDGYTPALGMYLEGNVIFRAESLVRNYTPGVTLATFTNNILPMAWTGAGGGNRVVDPLLVDGFDIPTPNQNNFRYLVPEIRARFALRAGSPARAAGAQGVDLGGSIPPGVTLSGLPAFTNNLTSATVQVGPLRSGGDIPAAGFPNGSGYTHYQWRLDGGTWSADVPTATPVQLSGLAPGTHTLEVVGRNDAGFLQNHPDFGPHAATTSHTWTVDPLWTPPPATDSVRISEVLAANTATVSYGGVFPDLIELHNPGAAPADISGWGLTENSALPYKYTFPSGTILAAGSRLVVHASGSASVPQPRTGFGLKASGDTLTLTRSPASGGGIADLVAFGSQLPDRSISRSDDGVWMLGIPTFGAAHVPAGTAEPAVLRINEWLADAASAAAQDFVELHNPSDRPVDLGGCFLTDNPNGAPDRHRFRDLSFVAAGGHAAFKADNDPGQGPDHLSFKLAPEQGELGLFSPDLSAIDIVAYGPQATDLSTGRSPDGAASLETLAYPTMGGPNPGQVGTAPSVTNTVTVIPVNAAWKYRASTNDLSAVFWQPGYDDSSWPSGNQLLYIETAALTSASGFTKQTALPPDTTNPTPTRPFNTCYFRRTFVHNGGTANVTLRARVMIDDGALFYLNGQEILPVTAGGEARLRMPSGAVNFNTISPTTVSDAAEETLTFSAAFLQPGTNVLAVAVHQNHPAGTQTSSDVVFGMKLDVVEVVPGALQAVELNELLVRPAAGSPWVELRNPGATAASLEGYSLSDQAASPRRFVFAPGTSVPAGAALLVGFNAALPASSTNAPFGLNPDGGVVALYAPPSAGGGQIDRLAYGRQITGHSLGRVPDTTGSWMLCSPTPGNANQAAATGPASGLRINEWLAAPAFGSDFVELHNAGPLPVPLGDLHLSDDPADRFRFAIPPLSFIGGAGNDRWQVWLADANQTGTPGHLPFALSAAGGVLALHDAGGVVIDLRTYAVAYTALSEGPVPDGGAAVVFLNPTPGAANAAAATDLDADGLPDAWELLHGLNVTLDDALLDGDGDGASNLQEFLAGTRPTLPGDALRVGLNGSLLTFPVQPGRDYSVLYKDDLSPGPWLHLANLPHQPMAGALHVNDSGAASAARRYYRIVTPAQP